ncbi:hypothetical protein E0H75_04080 [Kribbella capetownensis]|uniref:Secreted protein n=1 Tax=Kribbella capetownensis TaxID=1572659 RepID=A0A4R0JZA3_9ACTN|nr:hypothetical protein [Kribbella capetownensis]TCC52931.1 hypothetical protein E0H75_04080 [Kribbella capetownensis]
MRRELVWGLAGAALLTGAAAVVVPAQAGVAAAEGTAAACSLMTEAVTAPGDAMESVVTASTPPSKQLTSTVTGVYQPGQVRLATTVVHEPDIPGIEVSGWVVQGDGLYFSAYVTPYDDSGTSVPVLQRLIRIGGGWANFTALEVSQTLGRSTAYGLRGDGTLFRWTASATSWRSTGSATGLGAVKSMALISKTATYDTFLANLRGGSLYTIRIPTTSPMKPIVKPVRARTWQGFEKLIATKCGQNSTLLLGIDKDTSAGYLYAVGHANGTGTVIKGLGKVNGTFPDPVGFRGAPVPEADPLNGD